MKICMRMFTHPKYLAGGAGRQMDLLARYLIKNKKNIDVSYIINRLSNNEKKFEILNGIKIYTIGRNKNYDLAENKRDILGFIRPSNLNVFYKFFIKSDFDIYHIRGADSNIGIWAFLCNNFKNKKLIFTASSITNCIPGAIKWSAISQIFFKYGIKNADMVVVLAEYMKKAIDKNFNINSFVIKSGHPIPKQEIIKDDPPLILWISGLRALKRPELFMDLAKELKNVNAKFILIGPGKYIREKLNNFAEKNANFTYIPGVEPGKDEQYYSKASLLINTSIYEGYPNSFIQAWMHKTPVVSLDVDPDCDICENNLGFHAKGNFNKLIDKVKEYIEKPSELRVIGKNCQDYAIKNHNIENIAEQYFNLYKTVLKNNY